MCGFCNRVRAGIVRIMKVTPTPPAQILLAPKYKQPYSVSQLKETAKLMDRYKTDKSMSK
jgi:hypothetical protein